MEEHKTIDRIQNLVNQLKEEVDSLVELSKDENAEQAQLYINQVEAVKRSLNELMKLTMMLNVEDVLGRMRRFGPKAEGQIESFGGKIADAFKSFVDTFRESGDLKDEASKPGGDLSRERAAALYEEYRNLIEAGFNETQAMEIIRARCSKGK